MSKDEIELRRIAALGSEVDLLAREAEKEGHRFMARLRDEWFSGVNRFDRGVNSCWQPSLVNAWSGWED